MFLTAALLRRVSMPTMPMRLREIKTLAHQGEHLPQGLNSAAAVKNLSPKTPQNVRLPLKPEKPVCWVTCLVPLFLERSKAG